MNLKAAQVISFCSVARSLTADANRDADSALAIAKRIGQQAEAQGDLSRSIGELIRFGVR